MFSLLYRFVLDIEWDCSNDVSGPELGCNAVDNDITHSKDSNIECLIYLISFIMTPSADKGYPMSILCHHHCVGKLFLGTDRTKSITKHNSLFRPRDWLSPIRDQYFLIRSVPGYFINKSHCQSDLY